ncbi:hypothetical protein ACOME3_006693 [Neoechinorhynchus agilis]
MSERTERTFILVKPDGVQRRLVGEIVGRFEKRGYKLIAMKLMKPTEKLVKIHYEELKEKPFYNKLVKYILSAPVVAMIWQGQDVVTQARKMLGATNPLQATIGTVRGDFCVNTGRNVIHGSDSVASANREIGLWFSPEEIIDWNETDQEWVYE